MAGQGSWQHQSTLPRSRQPRLVDLRNSRRNVHDIMHIMPRPDFGSARKSRNCGARAAGAAAWRAARLALRLVIFVHEVRRGTQLALARASVRQRRVRNEHAADLSRERSKCVDNGVVALRAASAGPALAGGLYRPAAQCANAGAAAAGAYCSEKRQAARSVAPRPRASLLMPALAGRSPGGRSRAPTCGGASAPRWLEVGAGRERRR
jgi:hypothetical protein